MALQLDSMLPPELGQIAARFLLDVCGAVDVGSQQLVHGTLALCEGVDHALHGTGGRAKAALLPHRVGHR